MSLQEATWLITVVSFFGGIVIFLFKKIVIDPLQSSIDALNGTMREYKAGTDKQLEIFNSEISFLKEKTTRHDEQIKTLFERK